MYEQFFDYGRFYIMKGEPTVIILIILAKVGQNNWMSLIKAHAQHWDSIWLDLCSPTLVDINHSVMLPPTRSIRWISPNLLNTMNSLASVVCTLYLHECVDSKLLLAAVTLRYIAQTASIATSVIYPVLLFLFNVDDVIIINK